MIDHWHQDTPPEQAGQIQSIIPPTCKTHRVHCSSNWESSTSTKLAPSLSHHIQGTPPSGYPRGRTSLPAKPSDNQAPYAAKACLSEMRVGWQWSLHLSSFLKATAWTACARMMALSMTIRNLCHGWMYIAGKGEGRQKRGETCKERTGRRSLSLTAGDWALLLMTGERTLAPMTRAWFLASMIGEWK
jgi:hypothetical protein